MAKQDGNDFCWSWNSVSRRRFLRMLSAGGAGLVARSPKISWAATEGLRSSFEEIPSSASGILWVHTSGRSPMAHLPETVGAGCAFLDYDNDGWMDIYLVNSGPCDFYSPPQGLRNALYRNNRDGTFSDVTLKAG
ncbi:MAG: CRTAC1 family protein, partial [Acidobacteria bacterium]